MSAAMLNLPLTSVLLATLLLASDGLVVMPLVIVSVVVAYVTSTRLALRTALPRAEMDLVDRHGPVLPVPLTTLLEPRLVVPAICVHRRHD